VGDQQWETRKTRLAETTLPLIQKMRASVSTLKAGLQVRTLGSEEAAKQLHSVDDSTLFSLVEEFY
jgi:hypothetical protein